MLQINDYQNLGKSSHIIDELILQTKRDPKEKSRLGHESGECSNFINTNQLKKKYNQSKFKFTQKKPEDKSANSKVEDESCIKKE